MDEPWMKAEEDEKDEKIEEQGLYIGKRTKEKKRKERKKAGNCHKIAEIGMSHRLVFIGLWKMHLTSLFI